MTGTLGRDERPTLRDTTQSTVVEAWLGIKYATTTMRFAPPVPDSGRLDVRKLAEVPVFPQTRSRLTSIMGTGQRNPHSEEAHFLNIWAPAEADGLPVLLFIHGGAWMTGGGSQEWYDGTRLAAMGVVVVTVNYRLGALGHLGDQSQIDLPLPAEDLLLALKWVHEWISQFGGDPGRITLAGQSAGGWYGHLLSVIPQTRGMVYQVAHLSMGTRAPWTQQFQRQLRHSIDEAVFPAEPSTMPLSVLLPRAGASLKANSSPSARHGLTYASSGYLPVETSSMPTDFLTPKSAAQAVHAQAVYMRWTADESAAFFWNSPDHLHATQEQVDAEMRSYRASELPEWMLAKNGSFNGARSGLSPYQQLVAVSSWVQFQRFPAEYGEQLVAAGVPIVVDRFQQVSALKHLGSAHCFDLPFQFGNIMAWNDAPMMRGISDEEFAQVSESTMRSLVEFVCQRPSR